MAELILIGQRQYEVAETPREGQVFLVEPLKIPRPLFKYPRRDYKQAAILEHILEVFSIVDSKPEYAAPFYTMFPDIREIEYMGKRHNALTFKEYAAQSGGQITDEFRWYLELAQRISNEDWDPVCNDPDTAKHVRVIFDRDGNARLVGGSTKLRDFSSAASIQYHKFKDKDPLIRTVPSVCYLK